MIIRQSNGRNFFYISLKITKKSITADTVLGFVKFEGGKSGV